MNTPTPSSIFGNNLSTLVASFACDDPIRDAQYTNIQTAIKGLNQSYAELDANTQTAISANFKTLTTWLTEDNIRNGTLLSEQLDSPKGPLMTDTIDAISKALNLGGDGIWGSAISKSLVQLMFWLNPGNVSQEQKNRGVQLSAYTLHNVMFMYPYLSKASQAAGGVSQLINTSPFDSAVLTNVMATIGQFPTAEGTATLKVCNKKCA